MPRFRQTAELLKLMRKKELIRNVGIVAHIDHGKTTMTDSLLVEAGLLPPQVAGTARALDYLDEEQKRGITIKTANISLLHNMDGKSYVINLVDTPGHVDFTGKVTRALRAIDGAVVVVDAVEEVMAQTETVTRQALEERVRPVLFINKVDRLIKELRLNAEEIRRKFVHIITDFNNLIEIYGEPDFKKKWKVNPTRGTAAFGSALHKWGFTLNITKQKRTKFTDVMDAYRKNECETLAKQFPLHDAILDMVVKNCPNPVEAQKYRVPKIWKGKLDSEIRKAIMDCDENGPAVMCITNAQIDQKEGMIATGRLFSGSMKKGDQVHLVGADKDCKLEQVSIYMGVFKEVVDEIVSGNIAALKGCSFARIGETIVDVKHKDGMTPFEQMKYALEPVVTVTVEPENPKDLPQLVDVLNRLSIEDPNLTVAVDKRTGEYLLSGTGELHLGTAVSFLRKYSEGMEVTTSTPSVGYRESITESGNVVVAKSINKENSFRIQAEPLKENQLETLRKDYAENIWATDEQQNVLINSAQIKYIDGVKNVIIAGFRWACETGPLCEEPLRNVKVTLVDAQIAENPSSREPEQITRAVSRAVFGSFLTAKPVLLEPVYKVEVSVPTELMGECINILTRRRGKILGSEQKNVLTIVNGLIPVAETFGLAAEMRSATSGRAFWQCAFAYWKIVPEGLAVAIMKQIRKKRGLSPEIPKPEKFIE
jgi:elongation factor 2